MAFEIKTRQTTHGARYDVRYRDPAGKVRTKTFRKLAEARTFQRTTEADVIRGDWTDPLKAKVTFGAWWDRWWPSTVNLRPSSRARDESYYRNHLEPTFGTVPLGAIDHAMVAAWVAELSHGTLAPATVVKAAQILSKALTAAVRAGMIRSNPSANVDLPRIERIEMMFLTPDQVATLADSIDKRYRAFVIVGAYCGLRFGELAGLTRDRVDLLHRRIQVAQIATEVNGAIYTGPPKTKAGRRAVPVPSMVAAELQKHLDEHAGTQLVFPAPAGGSYLRPSLFRRRIWQPACIAAGVGELVKVDPADDDSAERYEGLRIHDLRHTAVALWIAAGASPKAIAVRAGHASVVTVFDRYGHLLPGLEDQVDDALDAMATGATATPSASVRAMGAR